MKNSVSENAFYIIESDEEEKEDEEVDVENDGGDKASRDDEELSEFDDDDGSSRPATRPSSYNAPWPQTYRQSIDMYSSVTSPNIGFLGTPASLSRFGSSFLSSTLTRRHTPEIFPNLIEPLIPSESQRQSSADYLPLPLPSQKSSSLRPSFHEPKVAKGVHEFPVSMQCSYGQAVLNGVNVLCGVGILSTPYAVKQGGWMGLSILIIFAILSWYTGILLRHCLDSEPGLETYPDIGQAAFGTIGRIVISIILYVELYACCVEYIILESDNLSSLFPNAHLSLGGLQLNSHHLFASMTTLAVLPTVWLRDMSILSYISAGGVIASILVVICLFWVGLVDKVGFVNQGSMINLPSLPVAVGLYGYCYSGHAVFPNIYTSMKKPSQYPSVLFTSFAICTSLYAGAAVMGYFMFGESTMSQFTLNMPQNFVASKIAVWTTVICRKLANKLIIVMDYFMFGESTMSQLTLNMPHIFVSSKIAVWTTVVNPFTKYALTMSPVAMSLEELIPSNHLKSHWYAIFIRTGLVISTLIVGLTVPFFGLVMALIGSFLTMLVTLILPCACFLSILKGKITRFQGLVCMLILLVGVVSCAFGTISALLKIVENLS